MKKFNVFLFKIRIRRIHEIRPEFRQDLKSGAPLTKTFKFVESTKMKLIMIQLKNASLSKKWWYKSFHSQQLFAFCFPNDLNRKKIWQFLLFTAFYNIISYSSLLRKSLSWATQSLALSVNRLWPCLVESNKLVFSDFFLGFPLLFFSKYIHHITFNHAMQYCNH